MGGSVRKCAVHLGARVFPLSSSRQTEGFSSINDIGFDIDQTRCVLIHLRPSSLRLRVIGSQEVEGFGVRTSPNLRPSAIHSPLHLKLDQLFFEYRYPPSP